MQRIESLRSEFEHEAQTTRTHLARVPEDRFDWRPHPRSRTAGELASHLVDVVRFAAPIFGASELDIDLTTYLPCQAATSAELLAAFDAEAARAIQAMTTTTDPDASEPWRLLFNGRQRFERPREVAYRDMTLSHMVHHRGQLSVYLRLMDVAVPASYGPSADG
jgi:uncharacterized damage-inducible protein DinB